MAWGDLCGGLIRMASVGRCCVEWAQIEKCVAVNNIEGSWKLKECFDIRHGDAELEFFILLAFYTALSQYFLTVVPFLSFGIVMHILCYYILEVLGLIFNFDFKGIIVRKLPWVSEETLTFGLLSNIETMGTLEVATSFGVMMGLQVYVGRGVECGGLSKNGRPQ